jgi:hypothetical protein
MECVVDSKEHLNFDEMLSAGFEKLKLWQTSLDFELVPERKMRESAA